MSEIQVSANFRIPNGMLEEFKQHAAECLKHVKEKDTETIQYDWFLNSDKTDCEIREKYQSSNAVLGTNPTLVNRCLHYLKNLARLVRWQYMVIHHQDSYNMQKPVE